MLFVVFCKNRTERSHAQKGRYEQREPHIADAIHRRATSILRIYDSEISSNRLQVIANTASAYCHGGAISSYGTLIVDNTVVTNNKILCRSFPQFPPTTPVLLTIAGGAIYVNGTSDVTINGSTLSQNSLEILVNDNASLGHSAYGGAVAIMGAMQRVTISNSTISNNTINVPEGSISSGGGVYTVADMQLTLPNTSESGNTPP